MVTLNNIYQALGNPNIYKCIKIQRDRQLDRQINFSAVLQNVKSGFSSDISNNEVDCARISEHKPLKNGYT